MLQKRRRWRAAEDSAPGGSSGKTLIEELALGKMRNVAGSEGGELFQRRESWAVNRFNVGNLAGR